MFYWMVRYIAILPLNCVQTNNWQWMKLFKLDRNTWNYLTLCKQMTWDSFKNVIKKMGLQILHIFNIYV